MLLSPNPIRTLKQCQEILNETIFTRALLAMTKGAINKTGLWGAFLWLLAPGLCFAGEIISFQGDLTQGSLVLGAVEPGYAVSYRGERLKLAVNGQFLVGLGRDAAAVMEVSLVSPDGDASTHRFDVRERVYNIQSVDGVPQRTVSPTNDDMARIKRDARVVKRARATMVDQAHFLGGFSVPIEGPITGVYGSQRIYNGVPKNPHYGVDYAASTGTIVRAPAAGIITMAEIDLFYSGGTLIMDHGHRLTSSFLHLSAILVQVGESVEQGDPIARVGATGRATGPHLDWRMNWRDVRVDPQLVLKALPLE